MADNSTSVSEENDRYAYKPSMVAGVLFVILFTISTLYHMFQMIRNRTRYFVPFIIGGFFQIIGYACRAIASNEAPNYSKIPYILQALLLLLSPALFAASIYMILGRIIRLTDGEKYSLVRATRLTKLFVTGDVLSFLAQCGGGGILASSDSRSSADTGKIIIVVGLIVQIIFFGCFSMIAGLFHKRIAANPTRQSQSLNVPWQRFLVVLYVVSLLIMIRSVFRLIEYIQGEKGYLMTHEVYLYIFDAVLMFFAMVAFNVWHPSKIIDKEVLKGHKSLESGEYMMEEGVTSRK
ncbi:rta1 domain-containing protein [Phlyctema vagabunda]|uniref:Rta1 domain-containing protein n=1 Tax=Phlyctema vagabunda TaxID=108571 RepID=A0ABR4P324_9HELO